jgi:hypothetical protein
MDERGFHLLWRRPLAPVYASLKKSLYLAVLAQQGARQPGLFAQEGVLAKVLVEPAAELDNDIRRASVLSGRTSTRTTTERLDRLPAPCRTNPRVSHAHPYPLDR